MQIQHLFRSNKSNHLRCQDKRLKTLSSSRLEIRYNSGPQTGVTDMLRLWTRSELTERKCNMADIYLYMSHGLPQSLQGKFS